MKKKLIIVIIGICILAIASTVYFNEYSIKSDMDVMAVYRIVDAKFGSERGNVVGVGLEEKEYIYLTTAGDDLVVVHLQRGLFERMRFNGMSYSDSTFCNGVVEVNGEKYIVVGGRNINNCIVKIEFSLDSKPYEIELKNPGELFLEYIKIDVNTEDNHIVPGSMKLFNSMGEDITSQYNLGSFGI